MAQAIDPVCNMTVDTETARHRSEYQGTTYYFCAPGCKAAFDKDPAAYLGGEQTGQGSHAGDSGHGNHGSGGH